ncbi:MAG: substrate-binding domain-containing protein [Lachnospiraceae bacterium]|nr:substrate-binding domain-containing protein [Lachnospiraceae bacterium]
MKKIVGMMLILVMMISMAGCSDEKSTRKTEESADSQTEVQEQAAPVEDTKEGSEAEKLVVGNIMITSAGASDQLNDQAIHDYFEAMGGEVITLDGEIDIVKINECIDDLISRGVDGIIVNIIDWEGHNSAIKQAYDAGIPIVTGYNLSTAEDYLTCQVTSDDYGAGKAAGEDCLAKTGGEGQVILLDNPGASCVEDRMEGFKDAVVAGGMEVVATKACAGLEESSEAMDDMLQAWPDVKAVMCNCDLTATGAISALKAAGKDGEILVYAVDGNQENLQFIKDGSQTGTSFSDPYNIGKTLAEQLYKAIQGEKITEKRISLPTTFVTIENVDQYLDGE